MPDSSSVRILDGADPDDRRAWLAAWQAWPEREVFAHPGYVGLYRSCDARPMAALLETLDGGVLYPFLLRGLPGALQEGATAHDLTTPYGYGGPFVWGDGEHLGRDFWSAFDTWCGRHNVVSEFVRFALEPTRLLPFPGTVEVRQRNVVRALDLTPEALWMDVEHKVRKNVKRAQRSGVTVETDITGERLGTFLAIYEATMDRRDAAAGYYFSREYFEAIHRELPGQFAYFFAMHEGRAVSTELVLVSHASLYSFLGGTLSEAFSVRPNDVLKYEVSLWGQSEGKARFVLGGGYAPDDGIYRYKTSFAPHGAVPFSVGTRVHDSARYAALVERRRAQAASSGTDGMANAGFFPAYRR